MQSRGWRDYTRKVSTKIELAYRSGETKTRVQTGKMLCCKVQAEAAFRELYFP